MEVELIKWLRETFGDRRCNAGGQLGIGDDGAIIEPGAARVVLTSDAIIENVHFDCSMSFEQIGRKALAVNLSDLAAMAAEPKSAIVNLCLPPNLSLSDAKQLYLGMQELIQEFDLQIIGGDTNVGSSELIISITAIGYERPNGAWRLDAANPGDRILVTGSFGGSRARKHFSFQPRCKLALYLNECYSLDAGTDVSDGLSLDLLRMATASGLGVVIEAAKIPISEDVESTDEATRLMQALGDGEDFELIMAAAHGEAKRIIGDSTYGDQLTDIGEFTQAPETLIVGATGKESNLEPTGYSH